MGTWSITGDAEGATINSSGIATIPPNTGTTNVAYNIKYTDEYGCMGEYQYVVGPGSSAVKCVNKSVVDKYYVHGLEYFNSGSYAMYTIMDTGVVTISPYKCSEQSEGMYANFSIDVGLSQSGYDARFFDGNSYSVTITSQSYELVKAVNRTVENVVDGRSAPHIIVENHSNSITLLGRVKNSGVSFDVRLKMAQITGGVDNSTISWLYRSENTFSGYPIEVTVKLEIGQYGETTRTIEFSNLQYLDGTSGHNPNNED